MSVVREYTSECDIERETFTQIMINERKEEKYDLEQFRSFLKVTKVKRIVVVDDFFADRAKFIESAKVMENVGGDGLTEIEVYHLKKLVQKARIQITQDERGLS